MFIKHLLAVLFSIPKWLRITLSITYLLIIAILSLLPANDFPETPLFPGADKIIHICMYLGLAWLVCWSMHSELKPIWYYVIFLFSVGYGAMMELLQFLMNIGRSFEVGDIIVNSLGTFIGILTYMLMVGYKMKSNNLTM